MDLGCRGNCCRFGFFERGYCIDLDFLSVDIVVDLSLIVEIVVEITVGYGPICVEIAYFCRFCRGNV